MESPDNIESKNTEDKTSSNLLLDKLSKIRRSHLLPILIIALAIPITVTLALQRQTIQENAAEKTTLNATAAVDDQYLNSQDDIYTEEYVPNTPVDKANAIYSAQVGKVDSQASPKAASTAKPNIVVIMLDDVNPHDGRLWNNPSITKNIYNYIYKKGINFTNYYGETPLCCPGRVEFLTGLHTQNHKVADNDVKEFNPKETLAVELQNSNYVTFLTGKYLNLLDKIPKSEVVPPGWSKFDTFYNGNGRYYNYTWLSKDGSTQKYGNKPADYSTDVIADTVVKRLKQASPNKPIFAFVTPFSLHGPLFVAPRHKGNARCANIGSWSPPNYNEDDISDKPYYLNSIPKLPKASYNLKTYCEMMLSVDDMVGRIGKELAKQGRLNNTIFILTADNGLGWGEHRWEKKNSSHTTPIPLVISWPKGRGVNPRVENSYISIIDMASTFCEIAGCTMGPYPNKQQTADGLSFLPLLKDQPLTVARQDIYENNGIDDGIVQTPNVSLPRWWAIRTTSQNPLGLWHYIELKTGEKELYNLSNGPCYSWNPSMGGDPCELTNLLAPNVSPDANTLSVASTLSQRLSVLKKERGFSQPNSTPTPSDISPVGYHDSSDCSVSQGWACDGNDYNQAISVHFYADAPAGSGTYVGQTVANLPREAAVGAMCGGNSSHGFSFTTPDNLKDGRQHYIYASAINIGPSGSNPMLLGTPKTITCSLP